MFIENLAVGAPCGARDRFKGLEPTPKKGEPDADAECLLPLGREKQDVSLRHPLIL